MPDWLLIMLTVLWLVGSAWCGLNHWTLQNLEAVSTKVRTRDWVVLHTVTAVTVLGVPLLLGWAALASGVHAWPAALYLVPHAVAVVVFAVVAYRFLRDVADSVRDTMRIGEEIREGTRRFLEDGEDVLTAFVVWQDEHARSAAEAAGFQILGASALAITQRRLLALERRRAPGESPVRRLLDAVPLGDIGAIKVRALPLSEGCWNLLVYKTVTLTVRGQGFKLSVAVRADVRAARKALRRARA